MKAIRNIRLCTKDCMCLYVCPTGATNTENGQIDASKCLDACRACVDACPEHAISKVPFNYPPQQLKKESVLEKLKVLFDSKAAQESAVDAMIEKAQSPAERAFAQALKMSTRRMAEDMLRESGYLLPQGIPALAFLKGLKEGELPEGYPQEALETAYQQLG